MNSHQLQTAFDDLERKTASKIEECYNKIQSDMEKMISNCFQSSVREISNILIDEIDKLKTSCMLGNIEANVTETNNEEYNHPMVKIENDLEDQLKDGSGPNVTETDNEEYNHPMVKIENDMEDQLKDVTQQDSLLSEHVVQMQNIVNNLMSDERLIEVDSLNSITKLNDHKNGKDDSLEVNKKDVPYNCMPYKEPQFETAEYGIVYNEASKCYECNLCRYKSSYITRIHEHNKIKHNQRNSKLLDQFECTKCNYVTTRKFRFNQHKARCESNNQMLQCQKCHRVFTHAKLMIKHHCSSK